MVQFPDDFVWCVLDCFDVFQTPSRIVNIMSKLKINPNLVEFSFGFKSVC